MEVSLTPEQIATQVEWRVSDLPRILRCPASQQPPDLSIESDSYAARLGTAVHAALARLVSGERADFDTIAAASEVERDDLAPLFFAGRSMWEDYADAIEVLEVEAEYTRVVVDAPGVVFRGHPDLVGRTIEDDEPVLVVLDWKSGRPDSGYFDQLLGYIELAATDREHGHGYVFHHAKAIVAWLRDRIVDIRDVDEAVRADWRERVVYAIEHPDQYGPSAETCQYCPRRYECPARDGMAQATANALVKANDILALAPASLAAMKPKADLLKSILKEYDTALKGALEGGPIPIDDDRELYLQERARSDIDLSSALPALMERFGSVERLAPALKVSKSELMKLVGARAERGEKGKKRDELMRALDEAGAISKTSYSVTAERKRT